MSASTRKGVKDMHKFLRTVGFSDIRKRDLEIILKEVIDRPELIKVARDSEGNEFAELSRSFATDIGITVRGRYNENQEFDLEYYFPYVMGDCITTREQIDIEKHAEKESYAGVCDELNLGVTLIFYLQNVVDYLAEHKHSPNRNYYGAKLCGLSVDGKILCPIEEKSKKASAISRGSERHTRLMAQAREGNEEAIESLTLEDMDTYAVISQRILKEDVFTIVKSTFMPYGIESDQYSVLGEIIDFTQLENKLTGEKVYTLRLLCNDIRFDVCINKRDLLGEPAIGRRFKGNIWMQGNLCID
jgi:hypothetical protein